MNVGFVECPEHGTSERTRVCEHVVATLTDGTPRGFWYVRADGLYQAFCTPCEEMDVEEWDRASDELARDLCYGCFERAAALNGVTIEKVTLQ